MGRQHRDRAYLLIREEYHLPPKANLLQLCVDNMPEQCPIISLNQCSCWTTSKTDACVASDGLRHQAGYMYLPLPTE